MVLIQCCNGTMVEWWNVAINNKNYEMVKFCHGVMVLWWYGVTVYSYFKHIIIHILFYYI